MTSKKNRVSKKTRVMTEPMGWEANGKQLIQDIANYVFNHGLYQTAHRNRDVKAFQKFYKRFNSLLLSARTDERKQVIAECLEAVGEDESTAISYWEVLEPTNPVHEAAEASRRNDFRASLRERLEKHE